MTHSTRAKTRVGRPAKSRRYDTEFKLGDIKIGQRHSKDFGDLAALADSIKEVGLLHPIGVTPDGVLVFGERRLRACRDVLRWDTIPARIVEVKSVLHGQIAENTMRKDYTVSERVAIVESLSTFRHGGDRRSDQARTCDDEKLTADEAAKRAGLGGKDGYYRAKLVVEQGVPELVEAMDQGELKVSVAAAIAEMAPDQQHSLVAKGSGHNRWVVREVRKLTKLLAVEKRQQEEREAIAKSVEDRNWTITTDQNVVECDLLITDPPQGVLPSVAWDNPPEGIEAFTRNWCRRWSQCGANYIVVIWNQRTKWEAKRWFDQSLEGFEFLQECCCHRRNYKKPEGVNGTHKQFRKSWEPVFVYRRIGFCRDITQSNHILGSDLTDDDHHNASYPTTSRNDDNFQQHKCQKPLSALRWLIHGLTLPGERVVDPFCGSGTSGIAALQLGRSFQGIEVNEEFQALAQSRLAIYGHHEQLETLDGPSLDLNSVTCGNCVDLIPCLPDRCIDLVLTSPPYAEQRHGHFPSVPEEHYPEFTLRWMAALRNKLTEDGSVLIVIDPHVKKGVMASYVQQTEMVLRDLGWKQHRTLIWAKPDMLPLGHKGWPRHAYEEILWFSRSKKPFCDPWACGRPTKRLKVNGYAGSGWTNGRGEEKEGMAQTTDVFTVPVGANEKGVNHPAQFPVSLAENLIQTFCPAGGTVLDPFAGSGSTLVAAHQLSRNFYGFEIVEDYCETARRRLAHSHKKRRKVG